MTHEDDAVKYAGTDVVIGCGTIEYDGQGIARVTNIDFGSDALDGQFAGICFSNRIFCTHNNYKRNTKTLIL